MDQQSIAPSEGVALTSDSRASRLELAHRMIVLRARTHTVTRFTNLSPDRLANLRRRWAIPESTRHRGPAPISIAQLLRSPRQRSEVSALANLCYAQQVIPPVVSQRFYKQQFYTMRTGERLCDTYELFVSSIALAHVQFDHLVLVAACLVRGDAVTVGYCANCAALLLIDRLSLPRSRCSLCQSAARARAELALTLKDTGEC